MRRMGGLEGVYLRGKKGKGESDIILFLKFYMGPVR